MVTQTEPRPRRSLLFVPGLRPDRYPKALAAGADIVCVDLEDAVALPRKDEARELTLPLFAAHMDYPEVERMARINPLSTVEGIKDILALNDCTAPPPALMIPKPSSAAEIRLYDDLLGGTCAHILFHVIIESSEGLENVHEIAQASPRIQSLLFGAVDLSASLRAEKTWETMLYARSRVHAAARFSLDLIDVPYLNLKDTEGHAAEARASRDLGFTGKAAIHPNQIPILNDIFTPTLELVARARRIIAEFATNTTGLLVVDGELIEQPVLRSMQRVVAIADRLA